MEEENEKREMTVGTGPNCKNKPPTTIEDVPRELMRDILSRLPFDSLFQCRMVSPSWRSLFKSNHLPVMHYTRVLEDPNCLPTSLVFKRNSYHTSMYTDLWYLHDIDTPVKAIAGKPLPFESLLHGLSVVGSCNGFLCLSECLDLNLDGEGELDPVVVICNPVNGDWIKLPGFTVPEHSSVYFGFGYTSRKKEYKLVRMQDGGTKGRMVAQVLTLGGSNTWKNVGTTERDIPRDDFFGVHVNGVLNWFVISVSSLTVDSIKTFNLEDETFRHVSVPKSIRGKPRYYLSLGALDGCLMVVDHSRKKLQHVWLMKNESWVLAYTIPITPKHHDYEELEPEIRPLSIFKDGKVFLQSDRALFSFDSHTKTHELVTVTGLPGVFSTTPHIGTLVRLGDVTAVGK